MLPHSIVSEENYLGCLINNPELWNTTILNAEDFYNLKNQSFFKALSELGDYDVAILGDKLSSFGQGYIAKLSAEAGFKPNEYQRIIKEKSNYRKLIDKYHKLSEACYLEEDLDNIIINSDVSNLIQTTEEIIILPTFELVEQLNSKGKSKEIYSSGIELVDSYLTELGKNVGGFGTGELVIISGQTGHGKTAFSQEITYNLALQNINSLWFSFEVTPQSLLSKFQTMGVSEKNWIYSAIDKRLRTSSKISWIKEAIKKAKKEKDIKAVFIDHLGFLSPEIKEGDRNMSQNYSAYLTQACRSLKTIALEENVIVFLMAHIVKKNEDAEPTTNDLKDSSGIAQEADTVIMVQRETNKGRCPEYPDYYTENTQILFTKNRTGGRAFSFWARFNRGHYLIENYQPQKYEKKSVYEKIKNVVSNPVQDKLDTFFNN